jgi:hypothetical protein
MNILSTLMMVKKHYNTGDCRGVDAVMRGTEVGTSRSWQLHTESAGREKPGSYETGTDYKGVEKGSGGTSAGPR